MIFKYYKNYKKMKTTKIYKKGIIKNKKNQKIEFDLFYEKKDIL